MENKTKLVEEKLKLIEKGLPKDPCKHCAFHDEDECGCDDRVDYQAALQRLHDLGIYDLMQNFQRINQNKSQIVWIRHEIGRAKHQIDTIQKRIDELAKECADAIEQLRKEIQNHMSKWTDIRCDVFNEEEERYMVEAWKAGDTAEHGAVIAKLDLATETVEYIDEDAKTDEYAQTVIREMLENGYILTE